MITKIAFNQKSLEKARDNSSQMLIFITSQDYFRGANEIYEMCVLNHFPNEARAGWTPSLHKEHISSTLISTSVN